MTLDISFVCTGNRYRSVLAEALFRDAARGLPVRVSSFGTLDLGPAAPLPEALLVAEELGLDISAHAARCVVGADLSRADLVLGFELVHAAKAVADAHARPERTFTILELVLLLERIGDVKAADPLERAARLIERAAALRSSAGRPASRLEIDDPIGLSPTRQDEIGRSVYSATARLAKLLLGRAPSVTTAGG